MGFVHFILVVTLGKVFKYFQNSNYDLYKWNSYNFQDLYTISLYLNSYYRVPYHAFCLFVFFSKLHRQFTNTAKQLILFFLQITMWDPYVNCCKFCNWPKVLCRIKDDNISLMIHFHSLVHAEVYKNIYLSCGYLTVDILI